jgi:uncharacterized protein YndB with AHSA1/START domain
MEMKTPRTLPAALLAAVLSLGTPGPAGAEATQVSASGFLVTARHELKAPPARVYAAIGEIDRWWNAAHSYSGQATNLSLARQGGGCFCERWGNNSIEHARVVLALEDKTLRLEGALGPLQALAVTGVWTFALPPKDGGTMLVVTYRVAGNEASGLDKLAGPVDGVITEQMRRLAAYVETGRPD